MHTCVHVYVAEYISYFCMIVIIIIFMVLHIVDCKIIFLFNCQVCAVQANIIGEKLQA